MLAAAALVAAQTSGNRDMSPNGASAAQVNGQWVTGARQQYTLGRGSYQGGKWIDITYGRPLKRGRDLWGAGPTYGKDALVDASIWRAGANVTTQLSTEVPLVIGGKTIPPGKYTVFIDLKERAWTFVLSSLKAQTAYDPNDKVDTFGAYNYSPDKDVLRTPMTLETLPHAYEQLSWEFVDMTTNGGKLAVIWDRQMASAAFTVGG
jgi:hypothetical protein